MPTTGAANQTNKSTTHTATASERDRVLEELFRSSPAAVAQRRLVIERFFTRDGSHPYDEIEWELRNASITGEDGKVFFEQKDVEFPKTWSQLATNVVVSKYFRGKLGSARRERSVKQLVSRVADTITQWGVKDGYFATLEDAKRFNEELTHLLVYQKAAFNSPVWFNVGFEKHPQCSACFILSVDDDMHAILDWIKTEGIIFKGGSGSGLNLSKIRSSKEQLSAGGTASGPVSFMRGADASAGAIKSGGKTRRAAKMVILNVDHPDIVEFIHCKEVEEKKAWALGEMGYDMSLNGEAWKSIQFQNANNSIRVTDEFMRRVEEDGAWQTKFVITGEVAESFRARELLKQAAEAAWVCGDPGIQYDTTINAWHTCSNTGRINGSNPCSEYMHLDDSACNLASLNLMKFRHQDGEFDVQSYTKAVDTIILAQEILVGNSSYPTEKITKNAKAFRELGLGYANLGALLMARGLPYDSDEGRAYAAAITALTTGEAYRMSAEIAAVTGPYEGYAVNSEPMLNVIAKHRLACDTIDHKDAIPTDLFQAGVHAWDEAFALGKQNGYRNSQATVIAPTGTIAFLMDCDTTGIEPDIALVKYKALVGGGMLKMVNRTVPEALTRLGYRPAEVDAILKHVEEQGTIEGAPFLKADHLAVFDCAFKPVNGTRSIQPLGHIKMMGAAQPFISGAISKTVNMPKESTVEDIMDAYIDGWRYGLKALAIYRDGSKKTQPLSTSSKGQNEKDGVQPAKGGSAVGGKPMRRRLPSERQSITHKFSVGGHEGYITVGLYEDGTPGEIFLRMAKEGSTISGLMDAFATSVSIGLQYGVPLKTLANKFTHVRFEPAGYTGNPDIPIAKSLTDYVFRWLALKYLPMEDQPSSNGNSNGNGNGNGHAAEAAQVSQAMAQVAEASKLNPAAAATSENQQKLMFANQEDAPACSDCGSIMVRNAACYKCLNCGATSGCS